MEFYGEYEERELSADRWLFIFKKYQWISWLETDTVAVGKLWVSLVLKRGESALPKPSNQPRSQKELLQTTAFGTREASMVIQWNLEIT